MANLNETAVWDDVRQIETVDRVLGGPGGTANVQAQQLVNRTALLKSIICDRKNPRGEWFTGAVYLASGEGGVRDTFTKDGVAYVVLVDHTSGVFATDLADGKFLENDTAQLIVDLAASGAGKGADQVGFSRSVIATAIDRVNYGIQTSDTGINILRWIDPAEWPAIFAGTSVYDCQPVLQALLAESEALGGRNHYVPQGTYRLNSKLKLGKGNVITGASRFGSQFYGGGYLLGVECAIEFIGIATSNGSGAKVQNLYIRGFDIGIKNINATGYWGEVLGCQIAQNRIGVDVNNGYINTFTGNLIQFNRCGMVIRGQSYAVNVTYNIIDNNTGGCGVFISGSSGVIITGNTIEGNRNIATKIGGCGIYINGFNQRTQINGNWFEINYVTAADGATAGNQLIGGNVIIGAPDTVNIAAIVANCIPAEYQALAVALRYVTGSIHCFDNFHVRTRDSYIIGSGMVRAIINIENETFVGIKLRYNRPVLITGTASGCNVKLANLNVLNTADISIDAEMRLGIGNSVVTVEGTVPAYNAVILDGNELYTKTMSMREFSQIPGASLSCYAAVPTSGVATTDNSIRCIIGASGVRTVSGTGKSRLADAGGGVAMLPLGAPLKCIVLKVFDGLTFGFTYQNAGGFSSINRTNANYFDVQSIPAPISGTVTLNSGQYVGYAFMSEAQAATTFAGQTRLKIHDLEIIGTP